MAAVSDRTVHAENEHCEIVRYDRAGKWYLEPKQSGLQRRRVGIGSTAVEAVRAPGMTIHFGLPGGGAFDRRVRRILVPDDA